ncbi:Uncharacterised protein [uncultured Blautia sp.]|nr:Uncharacterised protein [uncultured Blautia sp.]
MQKEERRGRRIGRKVQHFQQCVLRELPSQKIRDGLLCPGDGAEIRKDSLGQAVLYLKVVLHLVQQLGQVLDGHLRL